MVYLSQERNSSSDLLRHRTSPQRSAPGYDTATSPAKEIKYEKHYKEELSAVFATDTATGSLGFSLVQFGEGPIRIGGVLESSTAEAEGISSGDVVLSIAGVSTRARSSPWEPLSKMAYALRIGKGKTVKLALCRDAFDVKAENQDPDEVRHVWFQKTDSDGHVGLQVELTKNGPRIMRTFDDTPAANAVIFHGDRLVAVNGDDVTFVPSPIDPCCSTCSLDLYILPLIIWHR